MTSHKKMRLRVDIPSREQICRVYRAGTTVFVVGALGPDAWLVEVRVPDETLEGDAWYETLEIPRHELEADKEASHPGKQPLRGPR